MTMFASLLHLCAGTGFAMMRGSDSSDELKLDYVHAEELTILKRLFFAINPTISSGRPTIPGRLSRSARARPATNQIDVVTTGTVRSYAPSEFFITVSKGIDPTTRLKELIEEDCKKNKADIFYRGTGWTSGTNRIGRLVGLYLSYPFLAEIASGLPPTVEAISMNAGFNFFALLSIVYGTLTAATVGQASERTASLRALAVEEVTTLLALEKRLEGALSTESESNLLKDCLAKIWEHTNMFIQGSRTEELASISRGDDPLTDLLVLASNSNGNCSFALDMIERIIEMRGRRLSLENAGVPRLKIEWLRITSIATCLFYVYFTLDRNFYDISHFDLGFWSSPGTFLSASFGARAFFSYLAGVFFFAIDLADDLNQPFTGYFKIESVTILATLVQLRTAMGKQLGRSLDSGLYNNAT